MRSLCVFEFVSYLKVLLSMSSILRSHDHVLTCHLDERLKSSGVFAFFSSLKHNV